jgi:hypothetical protein
MVHPARVYAGRPGRRARRVVGAGEIPNTLPRPLLRSRSKHDFDLAQPFLFRALWLRQICNFSAHQADRRGASKNLRRKASSRSESRTHGMSKFG